LRAAHGGTLFLDEVSELTPSIQAKLLRAVEQREVTPLGESAPVEIDVRLLAATQGSLRLAVSEKRFRGDLLARLEGLTVVLPSLRERADEIAALFCKIAEIHGGRVTPPRLDPTFVEGLCLYEWPFNVRELTQKARTLMALHPEDAVLDASALGPRTNGELSPGEARRQTTEMPAPDTETFLAALRAQNGNVKQTAVALGISRGRAYRMMEKIDSLDLAAIRRRENETDTDTPD
jgi:transcriptional regulator with PAS, ATPase and Fis domain